MKATELIIKLQKMIEKFGDSEVHIVPFSNSLIKDFDVYYGKEDYILEDGKLMGCGFGKTLGDSHVILLDETDN